MNSFSQIYKFKAGYQRPGHLPWIFLHLFLKTGSDFPSFCVSYIELYFFSRISDKIFILVKLITWGYSAEEIQNEYWDL